MDYQKYSTEDFLSDESFQAYALDLNEGDTSFWSNWLLENPHKAHEVKEAKDLLTSFTISTLEVEEHKFDQDFARIRNSIGLVKTGHVIPMRRNFQLVMKIAASIALIFCIGYGGYFLALPDNNKEGLTLLEKSNPKGRKSTVMLPDGSKVKLNAESHLKYEEIGDKRTVYLRGEAFFEVAKDANRPFTVFSGEISTTALGTSFNVRAYPESQYIEVYLASGKVEVLQHENRNGTKLTLEPGQGANYNRGDKQLAYSQTGAETSLAWKDGTIIFDKSDFTEVKKALERWYGVEIEVIGTPDASWRINGTFSNESLENILSSLDFTAPLDYSISDNKVKIKF